jgi:anti-sigma regulatory factor (Ser/Thr protein kinase)
MRSERLELAPVSASGSILRRTLTERLGQLQIDEQSAGDFALAVTEAFSNAVNHGTPSAEERILASLHFHREQCSVTLVYPGDPFPTHSPALPPQWATSGRGRYIMSTLSDHVDYEFADGITRVRLVKRWNGGPGHPVGS